MKIAEITVLLSLLLLLPACAGKPAGDADRQPPEPAAPSPEEERPLDDCTITVKDISLSVGEEKQELLEKLDEAGLEYLASEPDDPEEVRYDSVCYIDAWMQLYFLDDACVRLRVIDVDSGGEAAQTARGLHAGDTVARMTERYGASYEKHSYAGVVQYHIYRYALEGCVCEFGVQGEDGDTIYNVDVYDPGQAPIYDYGEEIAADTRGKQ